MDFTSLCINLFMVVMGLLVAQVMQSCTDKSRISRVNTCEAFQPRITPDRLQFFPHEKISIRCEQIMGLTEWRVMQKPIKKVQTSVHSYDKSTPAYEIPAASDSHSGKYWCENADGEKSNPVNIIVTDGVVILDVPASPVMEGHDVSLFCQHRHSKTRGVAKFYQDDVLLETAHDSKLTIRNVSKSDEGLYKCSIKAEESPKSWLSIIKMGDNSYPDQHSFLWIVSGVLVTALFLSVLGLFLCQKHKVFGGLSRKSTPSSCSSQAHTASAEHSDADLHQDTYAVAEKPRKNKVPNCDSDLESDNVTYAQVESFRFEKGSNRSSRRQQHSLMKDGDIYSVIKPH